MFLIALDETGRRNGLFRDLELTYYDKTKAEDSFAHIYGYEPRLHSHTYTEILLVTKGKSKIVSMAQGFTVSAPYIVVYPAGIPHIQINHMADSYERCLLACGDNVLERHGCGNLLDDKCVYAFEIDSQSANVLTALCQLVLAMEKESGEDFDRVINRTFALLSKLGKESVHIHEDGEPLYEKSYMSSLLAYINEHYNEKLSLTSLASMFYISRTKLARDFNNVVQMSVGDYIMCIRLKKAQEKLNKGVSIAEVAKHCGFVSTSYFVQMFKKQFNKTPLHYVKQADKKLPGITFMLNEALVDYESIKLRNEIKQEENT